MNPIWHFVNGVPTIGAPVNLGPLAISPTAVTSTVPIYGQQYIRTDDVFLIGGLTASFPGLFRSTTRLAARLADNSAETGINALDLLLGGDVSLSRGAANRLDLASADSFNLVGGGGSLQMATKVLISSTAPTIASGFGSSAAITASNGTAAFTISVGTGGVATGGSLTMPAATTGWICSVENATAIAENRANQRTVQIGQTSTSVVVQNQTISTGAALAWSANDVLRITCTAF